MIGLEDIEKFDFSRNPTLSDKYIINLSHVLFFIMVSSIIAWILNKTNKKDIDNEKVKNTNNKNIAIFSALFALIISTFFTKSYAVIAESVYVYDIVSILINFSIILITNYILQLILNKNKSIKNIFIISIIENIIFNIIFLIGLMITNRGMAIIWGLASVIAYKILKIKYYKINHKRLYIILYSVILSIIIFSSNANMIYKNTISERDYNGHGIIIECRRSEYGNMEPVEKCTDIELLIQ